MVEHILRQRRRPGDMARSVRAIHPRTEALLESLRDEWRSAPELAAILNLSVRTVNRELEPLLREGLVIQSGEARARRYRVDARRWRDLSGYSGRRPKRR
jgi:DNA-binding IclR family transcriptional regulator